MKVIIAGSRTISDKARVYAAIANSGFEITEVVSGGQVTYDRNRRPVGGVDWIGEQWALEHGIPIKRYVAYWKTLGFKAGPMRNADMANYAEALILAWNGKSAGSMSMLAKAETKGLRIFQDVRSA